MHCVMMPEAFCCYRNLSLVYCVLDGTPVNTTIFAFAGLVLMLVLTERCFTQSIENNITRAKKNAPLKKSGEHFVSERD